MNEREVLTKHQAYIVGENAWQNALG